MTLWLAVAWADPGALRAPGTPSVAVELGSPTVSVAGWRGGWGGAVWTRLDGGSSGAALGVRRVPEGFGWTVHAALGPLVGLVRPGIGLHGSVSAGLGRQGERAAHRLELVLPASVGFGQVRLPVLFEGASAARVGALSVGGRGAVGAIVGDRRPSFAVQGGLVVGARLR